MLDRELMLAYQELGLSRGATEAELRKARITLVRRFHPDLYQGNRGAADQKLARINAAFDDVLAHLRASGRGATEASRRAEQARAKASDAARQAEARARDIRAKLRAREQAEAARKAARMRAAAAAIRGAEERMSKPDRSAHRAATAGFATTRAMAPPRLRGRVCTTA